MLYFDNAATTPMRQGVLDAMLPFFGAEYGNPSGVYSFARNARKAIEEAREQVAAAIGAGASEIFFTSGGTEANNWAIRGMLDGAPGRHIITTAIEHHAVTHVCEGHSDITFLPVDSGGFAAPEDFRTAVRNDTVLASIMWGNNEIGTIQPMKEISEIARAKQIPLHTDAVQAVGNIPVSVKEIPVDMLTMAAHKFGGPKGVGALYIRKGTKLGPLLFGGAQEKKRRAGTENVAGIVGMGKAISLAVQNLESERTRVTALRDHLIERITKEIPGVTLNGPVPGQVPSGQIPSGPVPPGRTNTQDYRLPGNINFSFDYIEGESLLLLLDLNGCCASSGSACSSASLEPSHVLIALGVPHEKAHGSVRFSLGHTNTMEDIDRLMAILPAQVKKLRDMSPLG